jgi:hypothetical protein
MAQVVECLPSKYKTLSLNTSTSKAQMAYACSPSYLEDEIRRTMVRGQPEHSLQDPISKITKMDWRCGSSDTATALRVKP